MSQTKTAPNPIAKYIRTHQVSLGTLLAAYGAFCLASVIMGGWTPQDWGKDVFTYPHTAIQAVMPRSFISPIFFVTSLPTLFVGAGLLCDCCVGAVRRGLTVRSRYAGVLLAVFGFSYLVVGAWPLQNVVDMPWGWQKQIMDFGAVFAWVLYLLGVLVLVVGGVCLWAHSRSFGRRESGGF
jgi:hypothetical protein